MCHHSTSNDEHSDQNEFTFHRDFVLTTTRSLNVQRGSRTSSLSLCDLFSLPHFGGHFLVLPQRTAKRPICLILFPLYFLYFYTGWSNRTQWIVCFIVRILRSGKSKPWIINLATWGIQHMQYPHTAGDPIYIVFFDLHLVERECPMYFQGRFWEILTVFECSHQSLETFGCNTIFHL